jgi:hypothetical protein
MSALPPKADIESQSRNVRFVPQADSCTAANKPLRAWRFATPSCIRERAARAFEAAIYDGPEISMRRHGLGRCRAPIHDSSAWPAYNFLKTLGAER